MNNKKIKNVIVMTSMLLLIVLIPILLIVDDYYSPEKKMEREREKNCIQNNLVKLNSSIELVDIKEEKNKLYITYSIDSRQYIYIPGDSTSCSAHKFIDKIFSINLK